MRSATRERLKLADVQREHTDFIKAQPCVVCQQHAQHDDGRVEPWRQTTPTEAAHVGPKGRSTEGNSGAGKGSFRRRLPICAKHHNGSIYSFHKLSKSFWVLNALDPEALITEMNERFDRGERAA